jgi:hypothetical protein
MLIIGFLLGVIVTVSAWCVWAACERRAMQKSLKGRKPC